VRDGDATRAEQVGVLVIPVGDLIQAAPPFTITDNELDEAFARLSR
jgi:adenosylmethionine-8-amino-7-oxononanoate aminotransferase